MLWLVPHRTRSSVSDILAPIMTEEQLIRDIPSIKKNLEEIESFRVMKLAMPLLRPILKLIKVDVNKLDMALAKVDELKKTAEELASIPDHFNDLFAPRGWIIYDRMKLEVAKEAIRKAEVGDVDGAEDDLVSYYDKETVRSNLQAMRAVVAFRPRMRLAEKALVDYSEERYHACVPVILALLDGLVNELHEARRGFFVDKVSLEAWDSIAAHSKGLGALANVFKKGRRITTTEQITIPYRHGIMHGMDLGYDNKLVAAKTWVALFATRDWAIKAERGLLVAPPEDPSPSLREVLQQIRDIEDHKILLGAWGPRNLKLGEDTPITGEPKAFKSGTPEHRLAEFLNLWMAKNYGYMARCLSVNTGYSLSQLAGRIRERYGSKALKAFEITNISDNAPAVTVIETKLAYESEGKELEQLVGFRLINEDLEGNPAARGQSESSWIVLNWNAV